eukprot:CAMPEP_0198303232 /NCGR_PEP_ID=MMETSP1449-20131203/56782_1 /TAXON_ID=420275 /ORGANISM="Attheya septentrionalis, Strain CCMP2084" /LENGTH=201 /DNA_ID=CAMNT_0044005719 /DNA_START=11 /DNA_END=616 /DNA_ORIENTATION=+
MPMIIGEHESNSLLDGARWNDCVSSFNTPNKPEDDFFLCKMPQGLRPKLRPPTIRRLPIRPRSFWQDGTNELAGGTSHQFYTEEGNDGMLLERDGGLIDGESNSSVKTMDQSVSSSLFENEDAMDLAFPLLPSLSPYRKDPSQMCVRCHLSDRSMPIFPSKVEPSSVRGRPSKGKRKRDSSAYNNIVPRNLFDRHFCLNCD